MIAIEIYIIYQNLFFVAFNVTIPFFFLLATITKFTFNRDSTLLWL